jgi:YjbR
VAVPDRAEVDPRVVARLRAICLALPEAREEEAWIGTRWRVRTKTFAHVVAIADGWPPAYARAAATDGPATVLTFRSRGPELEALGAVGAPFFRPPWHPEAVGLVLPERAADADWNEITELLTESYCTLAPARLVARVARPGG